MQLDKTQIAIRERGTLDTLDLALQVVRGFPMLLLATLAIGAIPLMILNHAMIGWMADVQYGEHRDAEDFWSVIRFIYVMALLVYVEAPLASIFLTSYIGQAVFLERPKLGGIVTEVFKMFPRILVCQMMLRGVIVIWLLLLTVERNGHFSGAVEGFFLPALAFFLAIYRAMRPYINEITVLERNPLSSKDSSAMTIARRSSLLHNPASGDLPGRWIAAAMVGVLLTMSFYATFVFASGVFLNDWQFGPILIKIGVPTAMWLTVGFLAVFRFLSYLDLRIRLEGWEVELRMRAEAARVTGHLIGEPV